MPYKPMPQIQVSHGRVGSSTPSQWIETSVSAAVSAYMVPVQGVETNALYSILSAQGSGALEQ